MIELASEYIRTHWRDTLDRVFRGETLSVIRYGKPVAIMVQPEMWKELNGQLEFTKRILASDANLSYLASRNLYLTSSEIKILLMASGVEFDTYDNLVISPLDEESATRIAATLYQRWESGKIQSVPWPEVKKKLQEMTNDSSAQNPA